MAGEAIKDAVTARALRDEASSVLRRRVAKRPPTASAKPSPPQTPVARSPERAASAAVSRAAQRGVGLELSFDSVTLRDITIAEIIETLPERALLSLVEGARDLLGVVAISPGILGALIEMQATGRVSVRGEIARMPTRTDGAFCADFVNMMLAELAADMTNLPDQPVMFGYRYASHLPDARPLELLLDEGGFRLIEMRVRAGYGGTRTGTIHVVVPLVGSENTKTGLPAPGVPETEAPDDSKPNLTEAMRQVDLPIAAVLCRRAVTLGDLRRLQPGDTLSLPRDAGQRVTLETDSGQAVARGRLGQSGGHYALRLSETARGQLPEQSFDFAAGVGSMGVPSGQADSPVGENWPDQISPTADLSEPALDAPTAFSGLGELGTTDPLAIDLSAPDPFRAPDLTFPNEPAEAPFADEALLPPLQMMID